MDHSHADHAARPADRRSRSRAAQVAQLEKNCAEFGIPLFGFLSERQGIVHVIGPEHGLTQPGMTIVCGDSHTATHGAFGALAFGIGTSEVEHVLATQCLLQRALEDLRGATSTARCKPGVTAKDIILALIAQHRHRRRHRATSSSTPASAIRALSMEERMTVCNMSIEGGARAGLIAPDDTTFEYPGTGGRSPRRARPGTRPWPRWRQLPTDDGADLRPARSRSTPARSSR